MKAPDQSTIDVFERSLRRCDSNPEFLDIFYQRFLASSPKVKEKFAHTEFERQKRLLRASFYMILLASDDPIHGPARYLKHMATRHSAADLDIGAELYDLWLDSLLSVVEDCDPAFDGVVEEAWEQVMGIGIEYMLRNYHRR